MNVNVRTIAAGRSDLYRIEPEKLFVKDDWNSRNADDPENIAHIERLAESIAEVGVKQPLTAYHENGSVFISDGHCRLQAVMLAKSRGADIKTIPVQMEGQYSSAADRVFSQIVRNSGKPLSPIEQSKVFKRLIDLGWSVQDISKKSGLAANWIRDLLELQASGHEIQELVVSGKVSSTLAMECLKKNGEKAGKVLQEAVSKAQASGKERATKKHIKTIKRRMNFKDFFSAVVWAEKKDKVTFTLTMDQYKQLRDSVGF